MSKIFLSHSATDNAYAQALAEELRKSNFDVFLDTTDIRPGTDWRSEITQAVESSDTFITLLSQNSLEERNSMIELGMAWGLGKNIVPVIVPGQTLSMIELPITLQEIQIIEARQQSTSDIAAIIGQHLKHIE